MLIFNVRAHLRSHLSKLRKILFAIDLIFIGFYNYILFYIVKSTIYLNKILVDYITKTFKRSAVSGKNKGGYNLWWPIR